MRSLHTTVCVRDAFRLRTSRDMNDYYASYFVIVVAILPTCAAHSLAKQNIKKKKLKLYTKKMNEKE